MVGLGCGVTIPRTLLPPMKGGGGGCEKTVDGIRESTAAELRYNGTKLRRGFYMVELHLIEELCAGILDEVATLRAKEEERRRTETRDPEKRKNWMRRETQTVSCHIRRLHAQAFYTWCRLRGITPNAMISAFIFSCISRPELANSDALRVFQRNFGPFFAQKRNDLRKMEA